MESLFALLTLLSLLLFANNGDARKDPGEYWRDVMKDQLMPEAIQGLIQPNLVQSLPKGNTNCHEEKPFVKDIEPVYPDAEKSFVEDFEPRPNLSVYHDGVDPKEDKSFVKDFEPRPDASVYHG